MYLKVSYKYSAKGKLNIF